MGGPEIGRESLNEPIRIKTTEQYDIAWSEKPIEPSWTSKTSVATFILPETIAIPYLMEIIWIFIIILLLCLLCPFALYRYLQARDVPAETIGLFMRFALLKIAEKDYLTTRGYQHLLSLQKMHSKLKIAMQKQDAIISESQAQLSAIRQQEEAELYRQYADRMVRRMESEIPRIGSNLAESIRSICYRGHLEDLNRAQYCVRGIGEQRQYQINAWVNNKINQYPIFIQNNPELKQEIEQERSSQKRMFHDRVSSASEIQKDLVKQNKIVMKEISDLTNISKLDFQLAQTDKKSIVPNKMINGIYAPWEKAPTWYTKLIQRYGG